MYSNSYSNVIQKWHTVMSYSNVTQYCHTEMSLSNVTQDGHKPAGITTCLEFRRALEILNFLTVGDKLWKYFICWKLAVRYLLHKILNFSNFEFYDSWHLIKRYQPNKNKIQNSHREKHHQIADFINLETIILDMFLMTCI